MSTESQPGTTPSSDRRRFVTACCAAAAGAAASAVPFGAGLQFLSDPIQRPSAGRGGFLRVATLAALPENGQPRKFAVLADRVDAWNRTPNVPVGAVYLRRKGPDRVEALNVSCPHAGCSVDYQPAIDRYHCPCHDSLFGVDGALADPRSPSARPLDTLEVEVREGGEVWVRFQNFRAGTAEKIPIA